MTSEEVQQKIRLFENNIRAMNSEVTKINFDISQSKARILENEEKIKLNKQLPYLVSNIIEILDLGDEDQDGQEDALEVARSTGHSVVVKTSTRNTIFLPIIGLVESSQLKPGELVGVNKDSYLVLEKLPNEYDSRVKTMELEEKP